MGADAFQALTRHYTDARYGEREIPDEALAALGPALEGVGRPRRDESRPAA
jgi:hypothetical protein